ncbi:MAG: hypothetical protein N2560_01265 [Ignavibacteria bacterium]|nr:hypothetical protein [Ignavibacteria bacterium]
MKTINYYFLILFFVLLVSCELFRTRTPEEPDETNLNFPPATTPQTLIDNFTKSFSQKNITIYRSCFPTETNFFRFIPSSDALSFFPSVFQNWNINSEINFAKNLFNKFSPQENPVFSLENKTFSSYTTDSTLFIADYELNVNSKDNSINNVYKGTLQLVLVIDKSGLWKIIRWYDFNKQINGFQTISILKAKLSS